ncbi:IS30 family transposase, partial [Limosilactobacillus reuteri]|nr:IS30 family transposase [Limosilactobacillus reuteri]MCC4516941.1 IS30 family transposase [Limosilactobacillus reuteri]
MINRCGRKRTQLSLAELTYINDKIAQGWTPDTIIGRAKRPISCNRRTLYRMFERGQFGFDVRSLPMRGKRHPNGYV